MGLKVTGLDNLTRQSLATKDKRAVFNSELIKLTQDWAKVVKSELTTDKSTSQIQNLFKVKPLEQKNKSNYRAAIEILILPSRLSEYAYDQVRITTGFQKLKVERKRAPRLLDDDDAETYTVVKLYKSSSFKQAKMPRGMTKIPVPRQNKGFLYKKSSRVNGNPNTPTGIYIRLAKKRYPLIMLRPVPLGYIINSKRIKDKLNFEKRLLKLQETLK